MPAQGAGALGRLAAFAAEFAASIAGFPLYRIPRRNLHLQEICRRSRLRMRRGRYAFCCFCRESAAKFLMVPPPPRETGLLRSPLAGNETRTSQGSPLGIFRAVFAVPPAMVHRGRRGSG